MSTITTADRTRRPFVGRQTTVVTCVLASLPLGALGQFLTTDRFRR